jgi:hypothetical protein
MEAGVTKRDTGRARRGHTKVDGGRKWMEAGSGWRQEVDGGGKWVEVGSGWRREVGGGGKWMEAGSGWRREVNGGKHAHHGAT